MTLRHAPMGAPLFYMIYMLTKLGDNAISSINIFVIPRLFFNLQFQSEHCQHWPLKIESEDLYISIKKGKTVIIFTSISIRGPICNNMVLEPF